MTLSGARHRPKIGYGRIPATDEYLDYGDLGRVALGPGEQLASEWQSAGLSLPDESAMRRYRLGRVRDQLRANDCDAILIYDPVNIRYATDTTNMSIWTSHNHVRYCLVFADGPVIMFEFSHGEFLDVYSENVDEIRPGHAFAYMYVGPRGDEVAIRWAEEIASLLREHGRGEGRLAIDTVEIEGLRALEACGVTVVPGMWMMEEARLIKSSDEVDAIRCAAHACLAAVDDMRAAFVPGITEMALWAELQRGNFARHGEWIETRILASGPRTNPWYHESSSRVIEAGDLMGFDTDLIGAYGMCIDMSRTWICGGGQPSAAQQSTYALALEQIERNLELFTPGASYHDITFGSWYPSADEYNKYTLLAHGAGMCDEYPAIFHRENWDAVGFDGELQPGMVICVEAFVGPKTGGEGVKLEQQILITDRGYDLLTSYPLGLT